MQFNIDASLMWISSDHGLAGVFCATSGAHGLYITLQFVLRLSPKCIDGSDIYQKVSLTAQNSTLKPSKSRIPLLHEVCIEVALSVGSTYGLMLSLSFPGCERTDHLKQFIVELGFRSRYGC